MHFSYMVLMYTKYYSICYFIYCYRKKKFNLITHSLAIINSRYFNFDTNTCSCYAPNLNLSVITEINPNDNDNFY